MNGWQRHMPTLALAAVIGVVLLALLVGYRLGNHDTPRDSAAAPQAPVALQTPGGSSVSPEPAKAQDAGFWGLTDDTRAAAGNNTGRQSELLEERLRRLPPKQIVAFEQVRHRLDERAYTWDLWGAAYVIEDGCSDDCFRDFRAYLISLGRGPYERALRDPDSLASVVEDAEEGDWENADNVAPDAYESVTGEDIPADDSDLSGNPRGEPWDDEDQDALVARYPRLAERFR